MKGTKPEEKTPKINRKKESELVLEYQQTRNEDTLLQIFNPRISTFRFLAAKYHYLCEDMESEIRSVFMNCVLKYGRKKGARTFNTYFYTSCLNHIRNMVKAKGRNKRTTPEGEDIEACHIRLDASLPSQDGGMPGTHYDVVASRQDCFSDVRLREFMRLVEDRSWIMLDIMLDIASSGIRCTTRKNFIKSAKMAGLEPEEAVRKDVGLPRDFYRIESIKVVGGSVEYVVNVSGQKVTELLEGELRSYLEGEERSSVV